MLGPFVWVNGYISRESNISISSFTSILISLTLHSGKDFVPPMGKFFSWVDPFLEGNGVFAQGSKQKVTSNLTAVVKRF